ncbi:MAG TPA: saccharopine dehydrogenase NADP-binding domain-containing protein [Symbiobacteriaceae bacterium]|nr:saccharopine dehydrogenase NADP-binding domain-containing protein [Symbiobacteriaceae bacterium]
MASTPVLTVLGSAGGVARAVLTILNEAAQDKQNPIHTILHQAQIHLVDLKRKPMSYYSGLLPHVRRKQLSIHQLNLRNLDKLREHLQHTGTTLVIDLSWGDTVGILQVCNDLGVRYLDTALENTMIDDHEELYEGFSLIERVRIFEAGRVGLTNTTAIIGTGMNPGVVQWMALEMMKREPYRAPLGLYVVEHDDTFFADPAAADPKTIYTTWAPDCFLDEAITCLPMFVSHRTPLFLRDPVYAQGFQVRLGSIEFEGCLMPHEEILSLCTLFDMEGGFLYRVNEHTTRLIQAHLANLDAVWQLPKQVLDPSRDNLTGRDLVGVLLVYADKETFMYNVMTNQAVHERFGVSATYFQVACGVYSALASLLLDPLPNGVFTVDELLLQTESRYGAYLAHYMPHFVTGENLQSDGLLLDRIRRH